MKYLVILLLIGLLPGTRLVAQPRDARSGITVTPRDITRTGDSLLVRLDIRFRGTVVESNRSLSLTFYMEDAAGNLAAMPEVLVNGKQRQRYYERQYTLSGGAVAEEYYAVVAQEKALDFTLDYRCALPYRDWMADAVLNMKQDFCNCGGHERQVYVERLLDKLPVPPPAPVVIEKEPVVHHTKCDVFLQFEVGEADIRPDFRNNRAELSRLQSFIRQVRSDRNISVEEIVITGYASPEGNARQNEELAGRRAEELKAYMEGLDTGGGLRFRTGAGGEDWGGLAERLELSSIYLKGEAMQVVCGDIEDFDRREEALRALDGGRPYREIFHEIYPDLRRVECRIDYTIIEK